MSLMLVVRFVCRLESFKSYFCICSRLICGWAGGTLCSVFALADYFSSFSTLIGVSCKRVTDLLAEKSGGAISWELLCTLKGESLFLL